MVGDNEHLLYQCYPHAFFAPQNAQTTVNSKFVKAQRPGALQAYALLCCEQFVWCGLQWPISLLCYFLRCSIPVHLEKALW